MGRTKARKVLQSDLSEKGIRNLADTIKQYAIDVERANEIFVNRLAEVGFDRASARIVESLGSIDRDKPIGDLQIISDESGQVTSVQLQFTGEQALFIEFGSGIKYNKNNHHPLEKKFGYGVGTYPNQTHAKNENGWNYMGNDGKFWHSKGTKASMPMYYAGVDMRQKIIQIAKEVYSSVI